MTMGLNEVIQNVASRGKELANAMAVLAMLYDDWAVGKEVRVDVIADLAWTGFEEFCAQLSTGYLCASIHFVDDVVFLCLQLGFTILVSRILLNQPFCQLRFCAQ